LPGRSRRRLVTPSNAQTASIQTRVGFTDLGRMPRNPAEISVERAIWAFPKPCHPQIPAISKSPDVVDGSTVVRILGSLPDMECAHSPALGIIVAISACYQCTLPQATSLDLALRDFQVPCPIVVSEHAAHTLTYDEGPACATVGATTPNQPQSGQGDGLSPRHVCSRIKPCSNNPSALSL
jgi:hypothetical protein